MAQEITDKNFQEMLENIAKLGGISGEMFNKCMNDKSLEKRLVDTYYMMLLVGVMQDYDSFNDENRNYVDKWLNDNLNDVIKASNSIKPLKFINKFIEPKKTLLYLGRYLKRKNRLD